MPGLNGGNLFCVLSHIFVGFFPFNARDMHVEKAKTGESTARGGLSRDLFELPFLSQMPKDGENVFFSRRDLCPPIILGTPESHKLHTD